MLISLKSALKKNCQLTFVVILNFIQNRYAGKRSYCKINFVFFEFSHSDAG